MFWRIDDSKTLTMRAKVSRRVTSVTQVEPSLQLRRVGFGQSIVVQQIPLDAIDEHTYDPNRSVSGKIQGRVITLL